MRHNIGYIKKIYIKETLFEYLTLDRFKKIINHTYKKISFLAKTSISATGYNKKIGENIAIIVKVFLGTFLINL